MSKVRSIFITGTLNHWSEIGGLPGLFLTVTDALTRGLDIFVGSSAVLKYIVVTWRYFVFRRGAAVNIIAVEKEKLIADSSAAFFPIQIHADSYVEHGEFESQERERTQERSSYLGLIDKILRLMFPSAKEECPGQGSLVGLQSHIGLPDLEKIINGKPQRSLSYIVRFLPFRGKFNAARAVELGIKPGKDFHRLTEGVLVVNSNGEIVNPYQVLGETKLFPKVAIIDIPDQRYLKNTVTSPEWFMQSEERGSESYGLVYHLLGDEIDFRLEEYVNFMKHFPPECIHVISHSSISDNTLSFKTSAIHLLKLKSLFKGNFNLPCIEVAESANGPFIKLQALQAFEIDSFSVTENNSAVSNDTYQALFEKHVKKISPLLELDMSIVSLEPEETPNLKDNVQVVTLGTGSALPSIHRNVLCNLVRIPYLDANRDIKYRAIILDAGEGSLGLLLRNYGHNNQVQYDQIMDELSLIYLSHLHADHNLGIVSLIRAWFEHNTHKDRKLFLVIPWQFRNFLLEWFQIENDDLVMELSRICFIRCELLLQNRATEIQSLDFQTFEEWYDNQAERRKMQGYPSAPVSEAEWSQLKKETGMVDMETCVALHCSWAYSVSMTFQLSDKELFKLSFSGDTRPNPKFVEIGHNSDLLIHEASLDDACIEEALDKRHSTFTEAVRVSQLMQCKKLLLTHFSTRFSEKPDFFRNAKDFEALVNRLNEYLGPRTENVLRRSSTSVPLFDELEICYAYDFMSVRLDEMGYQKSQFDTIDAFSVVADDAVQLKREEKRVKSKLKQYEKRNTKRQQRLAAGEQNSSQNDLDSSKSS